jgi:mono/diheme cytochrome c family protein
VAVNPFLPALIMAAASALPATAAAADPARGQALYELHCQGCHAESVHARAKRVAKSFDEVRSWVARWNASLSLAWSGEEIDDVALHLNTRYYRYPCPPTACRVVSQAPVPAPRRPVAGR